MKLRLYQRHQTWWFEYDYPSDVIKALGRRRRESLKTRNKAEATKKLPFYQIEIQNDIDAIRHGKQKPTIMDRALAWQEMVAKGLIETNATGQRHQETVSILVSDEADKVEDEEEGKGAEFYRIAMGQQHPLEPLLEQWKGTLRTGVKTDDESYRIASRFFLPLGTVESVTRATAKEHITKLRNQNKKGATIELQFFHIKKFWRWLQFINIVPEVDMTFEKLNIRSNRTQAEIEDKDGEREAWSPEEMKKLWESAIEKADQPLADLISMAMFTGSRLEEMCRLKIEDVDGDMLEIKGTKTAASQRRVPIHRQARKLIDRLVADSRDGYLIPSTADNQYGRRSEPLGKRFGKLKSKLGFAKKVQVAHSFRHSLTSMLEEADTSSEDIQRILGQKINTMAKSVYSKGLSDKRKTEILDKVTFPFTPD